VNHWLLGDPNLLTAIQISHTEAGNFLFQIQWDFYTKPPKYFTSALLVDI